MLRVVFLKAFKSLLLFSKVGAAALKCLEPDSCTESVRKVVRKYPKGVKVFVLSSADGITQSGELQKCK